MPLRNYWDKALNKFLFGIGNIGITVVYAV